MRKLTATLCLICVMEVRQALWRAVSMRPVTIKGSEPDSLLTVQLSKRVTQEDNADIPNDNPAFYKFDYPQEWKYRIRPCLLKVGPEIYFFEENLKIFFNYANR